MVTNNGHEERKGAKSTMVSSGDEESQTHGKQQCGREQEGLYSTL